MQFTRSKNPPEDHFNSVLSFGYSLLFKEMYGIIESKGLNPYFGFIHSDKEGHPALVSDMIEEWRAIIVDSMILDMINSHEITLDDFQEIEGVKSFYLNDAGRKKLIAKYNSKMNTKVSYICDHPNISYRRAMDDQVKSLIHVIDEKDGCKYSPIFLR